MILKTPFCLYAPWTFLPPGPCSVQLLSRVQLFVTPWTAAHQASLSITNSKSLLTLMSIESVMPSNHLIHPLSSPSPPTFSLSQHQGLFRWVSYLRQVAKVLEFSASASVLPVNIFSPLLGHWKKVICFKTLEPKGRAGGLVTQETTEWNWKASRNPTKQHTSVFSPRLCSSLHTNFAFL